MPPIAEKQSSTLGRSTGDVPGHNLDSNDAAENLEVKIINGSKGTLTANERYPNQNLKQQ